jgi:hypothetical protein
MEVMVASPLRQQHDRLNWCGSALRTTLGGTLSCALEVLLLAEIENLHHA